jgi:single-strand DNA-binding protein
MKTLKNRVQLVGHVGNAPQIITFENGSKMAKFSIATKERYKDLEGNKNESVNWHSLVAWGKVATIIENYVGCGQEIGIEGKLITRLYISKNGDQLSRTDVQVTEVMLLANKKMTA